MAERSVEIRVTVDDADAIRKLDELGAKLDKFARSSPTARVSVDDGVASSTLDRLQAKIDKLKSASAQMRVGVDDGDTTLILDKIALQLDKLSKKVADPKITVDGTISAISQIMAVQAAMDRLNNSGATIGFNEGAFRRNMPDPNASILNVLRGNSQAESTHLNTLRTVFAVEKMLSADNKPGLFSRFFGSSFTGFTGGSGFGRFLAFVKSFGGGAGAAGAGGGGGGGFTGPLIGTGIGAALALAPSVIPFLLGGGLGGLATFAGFKYGAAALKQQATLQQAVQSATPGAQRRQAREALAQFNQQNAAALAFGHTGQKFNHIASQTLLDALTKPGPGFSAGPHGQPGGSFLQGINGIVAQLSHFVKAIGPQLGEMFRASLPFVSAFVRIMEQFTKAVMPALTQMMRQFTPILPIMVQGFKLLAQGIAGFIRNLGPGMKDSAIIFKAAMMVVKGVLQLVGAAASFFAKLIVNMAEGFRTMARDVPIYFDKMKNGIVSAFHAVVSFIASAWNTVYTNTINWVTRIYNDALNWFKKLPGSIKSTLMSLPGTLYNLGVQALTGLLHGLESMGSTILGWLGGLASKIGGAIANMIPGGSIVSGIISKVTHMAQGGTITEPIIGRGLRTGTHYTFGEGGLHEQVTPLTGGTSSGSGGNLTLNINGVTVLDDSAALKIIQAVRTYKIHNGNVTLGIA